MNIDKFSFGNIYIDGKKYQSDLVIYENKVIDKRWWRKEGHLLQIDDIEHYLTKQAKTVLVGRGVSSRLKLSPELQQFLYEKGIILQALSTNEACERYNKLFHSGLLALFHLTC